jgi:glycosyltransferase involved in cell wall biosynthesis
LIIENGSNDATLSLANAYESKDKRFRVFKNNEKGAAKARNLGIDNSSGDYLTFIDADDKISSDYLASLMNGIKLNNADISSCSMIGSLEAPTSFYDLKKREDRKKALKFFNGATVSKLYTSSIINEIRYDSIIIGEDPLFNLKIIAQDPTIQYIKYSGYYYLENSNSITASIDKSIMDNIFHCNSLGFKFLNTNETFNKDLYRYWLSYAIHNILVYNKKTYVNSELSIKKNLIENGFLYERYFSINFTLLKLLSQIPNHNVRNISLKILMYFNSLRKRIHYPFLDIISLYRNKMMPNKNEKRRIGD